MDKEMYIMKYYTAFKEENSVIFKNMVGPGELFVK
jgi:hypothetical protein